jgi:hypothetical protein
MKRTPVKSSNIASVGYHSASRTLEVEFTSGNVYEYKNVTPATALAFRKAKSKGQYFFANIKNKFEGKKL